MTKHRRNLALAMGFVLGSICTVGAQGPTSVETECAIAKMKALLRHARCLARVEIKEIKGKLSKEEAEQHVAACEARHAARFEKAEARAEAKGESCRTVADAAAIDVDLDGVIATATSCATSGPYLDNCDGTITDRRTGLMWEKKTGALGQIVQCGPGVCVNLHDVNQWYTWGDAVPPDFKFNGTAKTDFIDKLNGVGGRPCFAGYCDWRLPEVGQNGGTEELESILDFNRGACAGGSGACIDPIFGPTSPAFYWSSVGAGNGGTWWLDFKTGTRFNPVSTVANPVRAVRTGEGMPICGPL